MGARSEPLLLSEAAPSSVPSVRVPGQGQVLGQGRGRGRDRAGPGAEDGRVRVRSWSRGWQDQFAVQGMAGSGSGLCRGWQGQGQVQGQMQGMMGWYRSQRGGRDLQQVFVSLFPGLGYIQGTRALLAPRQFQKQTKS